MYEVFKKLLEASGVSASTFCKETGIAQSTVSTWKQTKTIGKKHLQTVADYFNVTVEYVMTGEEKQRVDNYYLNDETVKIAQQIFENKDMRALFDASQDASPEDLKMVHSMLLALKRKETKND